MVEENIVRIKLSDSSLFVFIFWIEIVEEDIVQVKLSYINYFFFFFFVFSSPEPKAPGELMV